MRMRIVLSNYFTGPYSIARTTMIVGKQRMPVLLDSLHSGWQANELARDNNGLLWRTLVAWFTHNVQPSATARALYSLQYVGVAIRWSIG